MVEALCVHNHALVYSHTSFIIRQNETQCVTAGQMFGAKIQVELKKGFGSIG